MSIVGPVTDAQLAVSATGAMAYVPGPDTMDLDRRPYVPATTQGAVVQALSAPTAASHPSDKWLGQWNGPEGIYLLLSKKDATYVVKIRSLDGLKTYEGTSAGDNIQFTRDSKIESIHAGEGEETWMKWLLDKKNCLIIKIGEGFCRNWTDNSTAAHFIGSFT